MELKTNSDCVILHRLRAANVSIIVPENCVLNHLVFFQIDFTHIMYKSAVLSCTLILVVAVNAASHKRFQSPYAHDTRVQVKDEKGCDAIISSCGKDGRCCDKHDECYKNHGCDYSSWLLVREYI